MTKTADHYNSNLLNLFLRGSYVSGSGLPTLTFRYTVSSTDVDQDGVQLASNVIDLNGGTLTDPIGGAGVLEFPNLAFDGVIVNGAGPLVQMISRLDATPTEAGSVRFAVQFAEDVTAVDAADFAVVMNAGELAGAGVVSVSGSGSLYEVTVSTGTGSGTLGLSVLGTASIFDLDGDLLGKGYFGGQVYTVRPEPVGDIDTYYVEGHADYRPVYNNGEFSYIINPDDSLLPEPTYPSDEVITYLDSTAIVSRPEDANYEFLGIDAGEPYYLSNSSGNIASVPFIGFSGESILPGTFAAYRPDDSRITSNTPRDYLKVQMVGMRSSGGGDFSIYSIASGNPRVWMASSDGISSTDNIWLRSGSHSHFNVAFSEPGNYEVDVVVSGYLDSNGNGVYDPIVDPYTESGIKTMVFHVDTLGARDDAYAVNAGEILEGSVTANDEWHPGLGEGTASVVTTTTNGTLTLQPDGSFTYVPPAGFVGTDNFVYRLTNPRGGFTTATVTVTVNDSNDAPTTSDDAYLISSGNVLRANVLANDSDPDGDTLTVSPLVAPQHGSLNLASDGSFTYTPDGTFAGSDSFTYTVTDPSGATAEATVTIAAAGYQDFQAIVAPGHADVGINYEDGAWDLHVHYDEIGEEYEPDEAIYYIAPGALSDRPAGSDFDFIGVAAGQPIYHLPQTENPELLYLGLGAEEVEGGTFEGGTFRVYLRAVNGPGQFSMWESTDAGPIAFFATGDGIAADDFVDVLEGGHGHYNWGFTEKGRYEVTIEAVGTLVGEDTPTSATATYFFSVDNLGRLSVEPADAVDEGGTQTITIRRTDGSDGPLTIQYGAGGGTATAGSDYGSFGGTLTFADGETEKTFTIVTLADDGVEGDETVVVDITPERDDLPILGESPELTLTIRDDDPPLRVDQVLVNDGAAQRSNIESLTVRFSRETNLQELIDGGDVVDAVKVYSGGSEVALSSAQFQYDAAMDILVIDLTVDGFGWSRSTLLADSDYELQLDAAMIATTGQAPASGLTDNDGTADGSYRSGFHRLQGDFNGDRVVSAADVDLFLAHYGGIEGRTDGKYDFAFDLTGPGDEPDGVINLFDYVLMRKRMGRRL